MTKKGKRVIFVGVLLAVGYFIYSKLIASTSGVGVAGSAPGVNPSLVTGYPTQNSAPQMGAPVTVNPVTVEPGLPVIPQTRYSAGTPTIISPAVPVIPAVVRPVLPIAVGPVQSTFVSRLIANFKTAAN